MGIRVIGDNKQIIGVVVIVGWVVASLEIPILHPSQYPSMTKPWWTHTSFFIHSFIVTD